MLIYIGAIVVIFLFLITMLELDKESIRKKSSTFINYNWEGVLYALIFTQILRTIYYINSNLGIYNVTIIHDFNVVCEKYLATTNYSQIFGDSYLFVNIFTYNYYFFIVVGFVLLLAMVGSITICIQNYFVFFRLHKKNI